MSIEDQVTEGLDELTPESIKAMADEAEKEQTPPSGEEDLVSAPSEADTTGEELEKTPPPKVEGQQPPIGEGQQASAYEPDLSYRVHKEVKEFDPRLKGIIKSKEDEDFVRDLYTRADGLEVAKANYENLQGQYQAIQTDISEVLHARSNFDLKSIFDKLQIPTDNLGLILQGLGVDDQTLIRVAYEKASTMDLTPEQRQAYTDNVNQKLENWRLATHNQQLETQATEYQVQQRKTELQWAIETQDVAPTRAQFDAENGTDAFFYRCVDAGRKLSKFNGREATAQEAVHAALEQIRYEQWKNGQANPPQAQEAPAAPTAPANKPRQKEELPTIPAVDGSNDSPAEKVISSVEDIERIYNEKFGSGRSY